MKGYTGRILFVDLTSGKKEEQSLPESTYRDFIGGVGLGARILYECMKPKVDPLGSANMLGFLTGPLIATQAPMAAKHIVVTKSPLTNTWGEANSGGGSARNLNSQAMMLSFLLEPLKDRCTSLSMRERLS